MGSTYQHRNPQLILISVEFLQCSQQISFFSVFRMWPTGGSATVTEIRGGEASWKKILIIRVWRLATTLSPLWCDSQSFCQAGKLYLLSKAYNETCRVPGVATFQWRSLSKCRRFAWCPYTTSKENLRPGTAVACIRTRWNSCNNETLSHYIEFMTPDFFLLWTEWSRHLMCRRCSCSRRVDL